jgi:excisionase family DNA binding protein
MVPLFSPLRAAIERADGREAMERTRSIPRPLTTREAAQRLGVAKGFLEKLRMTGGGPPFLKIGHKVVYERAALEAWVGARRTDRTPAVNRGQRKRAPARALGSQAAEVSR